MSSKSLKIHHEMQLTATDVLEVAQEDRKVELAPDTYELLKTRRRQVVDYVLGSATQHYGFNRGFGHNVKLSVDKEGVGALQENLLRSHACGVGDPAPPEVVRATMLLRAASLARGHSGVRPAVVERLLEMLDHNVVPVVPRFGSVGASGDLAPLSHMALPLMGEGEVVWGGERRAAGEVLSDLGWEPLQLEMKEGLALNNGIQFTTAIGFVALDKTRTLLENAALVTALSAQVFLGADTPFRRDLHLLRPHPGACRLAGWIWQLMQGSPIREFHRPYDVDGEVQDAYSFRCSAQILGACAELIDDVERTLLIEANSVTDNPVILKLGEDQLPHIERGEFGESEIKAKLGEYIDIVSGGHFHGMPVAVRLYGLLEAMGIMARLSNMRAARYVDEGRNRGLPADLIWPDKVGKGVYSGMMIPEYVSAGLTNWIWGSSMPTHLFSLSTDAGQEDHVSMSAGLAVRVLETLPRLSEVLAIEFAYAAQARAVREAQGSIPSQVHPEGVPFSDGGWRLSLAGEKVVEKIWEAFPVLKTDEVLSDRLQKLAKLVADGTLVDVASETLRKDLGDAARVFPDPRIGTVEQG